MEPFYKDVIEDDVPCFIKKNNRYFNVLSGKISHEEPKDKTRIIRKPKELIQKLKDTKEILERYLKKT